MEHKSYDIPEVNEILAAYDETLKFVGEAVTAVNEEQNKTEAFLGGINPVNITSNDLNQLKQFKSEHEERKKKIFELKELLTKMKNDSDALLKEIAQAKVYYTWHLIVQIGVILGLFGVISLTFISNPWSSVFAQTLMAVAASSLAGIDLLVRNIFRKRATRVLELFSSSERNARSRIEDILGRKPDSEVV